jgi:hypothetical protein
MIVKKTDAEKLHEKIFKSHKENNIKLRLTAECIEALKAAKLHHADNMHLTNALMVEVEALARIEWGSDTVTTFNGHDCLVENFHTGMQKLFYVG